ncbi:MAG: hypothetical protein J7623_22285 [Chitinophaga sp.]|uniref:hypothetical protein n=1 Tax=Chitinophaga sp. TaxID=1869181 RepID=UPI001B14F39D|nr:hypothetical protein [Chitinophaga sp.]MBO9731385.1 hypothetical protein [Chitinophaga sp.]
MLHFKYTPLVSLEIKHAFYSNAHATDVLFIPTPSALAVLDAYGMKFKQSDGNLKIYLKRDEAGDPFVQLDTVIDLFFGMRIKTDLLNITQSFGKGRYWFSNLKEDGTYQQQLVLSATNELPDMAGQQTMLNFPAGTVDSVTLKRPAANPSGWVTVGTNAVDKNSGAIKIVLADPGLYLLEKNLTGGGTATAKMVLSDELMKQSNNWAILHLQLKPGDDNLVFSLTLGARASKWQYYLVEPVDRGGAKVDPTKLTIAYSASNSSRYPPNVDIQKRSPFPTEKAYIDGLKADGKIKEVYLFESLIPIVLADGEQPVVKLNKDAGVEVGPIAIPDRSMKNTTIIYKL